MLLEGIRFIILRGTYHIYPGASSIEVEYSALICNHNYSRVCISVVDVSRVYIPYSTISVCSIRVLREERTTVISRLHSEKTSYLWLASVVGVFKTYSGKFCVN